jgi:hypothetical protein
MDLAASSSTATDVGGLVDPPESKDDSSILSEPSEPSELSELSDNLTSPTVTRNPARSISSEPVGPLAEILEAAPLFFPCKIRYMDLTVLKLKYQPRVPLLMLVRSEWDLMTEEFRRCPKGVDGSVVITGQPGIGQQFTPYYGDSLSNSPQGKTCFLYYSLVLRLIGSEHTVLQDQHGSVFLITDQVRNEGSVEGSDVLALVDADGDKCKPSKEILDNHNYRILLVSSPRTSADRKWMEQHCPLTGQVLVMEPCSWEEVLQIAFVQCVPFTPSTYFLCRLFLLPLDIPFKRLHAAVQVCGNTPRRCLTAAVSDNTLEPAKADIIKAITGIEDMEKTIRNVHGDRSFPHRVFEIYPRPDTKLFSLCLVRPVSRWAFNELMIEMKKRDKDAAYKFYKQIQGTPNAAAFRGLTWECHR